MGLPPKHPLGAVLLGAALTTVGMGLVPATAAAEPAATQSTSDSRPAPATDVRSMTDRELGAELGRVSGKDSLRTQEVVTEMKARGQQFWEAAPPTRGVGVSGAVPVRPGVSVGGTVARDPANGHWVTSGGVRVGKPSGPQFTGIAPKPDGLNAEAGATAKLGEYGEFSSRFTFNVGPDLSVSGSYKAKGTVKGPDGRSYEMEFSVERKADGTWSAKLPDGYTTSTTLPGGGSIDTTTPADPTQEREQPEVKGPAPQNKAEKKPESWLDWGAGVSVDREIRPAPLPPPTAEELEAAKEGWARSQREQRDRTESWKAQNRPEAERREGLQAAQDGAAAAEASRRAGLPDRDHDGRPDEEDQTPNQNDTDPASADVGDGPEGGRGYGSDRVTNPPLSEPPAGTDLDQDGVPNTQDPTWNQNDTDPAGTDQGDGPEGGTGYTPADPDGDGLTGSADATPNQNDTDPTSTDLGDGPEGGTGYNGSTGQTDTDGDGLTGSADATPNQNDTDPTSTDVGDGPEGGAGYDGSSGPGGAVDSGADDTGLGGGAADSGYGAGSADSGSSGGSTDTGNSGYGGGSADSGTGGADSGYGGSTSDSGAGADTGSGSGSESGADTGTGGSAADSGYGGTGDTGTSASDADGDGLSGAADSTPNQNDTDPSSTDVGDGPEGGAGYGSDAGGYGTDPGAGDCACV
jgi:hypothetical protein